MINFRLLVLRTDDQKRLADFYSQFGLTFDYHQHGNSPFHYTAEIDQMVLEIYPLEKNQTKPDTSLRLGFSIDHFDDVVNNLKENEVPFQMQPKQTDFGFMAIIIDPDGRKVELYKN
ncbi:VOC family protein [Flavobacterium artemisiae]|uniref:VOC family protein n=1 Tax=Flavobacterium artemisiae TaxID=2126556 RepID=A0ABW4HIU2_9FLAO